MRSVKSWVRRWWRQAHSTQTVRRPPAVPSVEPLEGRLLLAAPPNHLPILVTEARDDWSAPIKGSLRAAIIQANDTPGADIIRFAIKNAPQIISVRESLPPIRDTLVIDATPYASFERQSITLEYVGRSVGSTGLSFEYRAADPIIGVAGFNTNGSAVYGLTIQRFKGDGIRVYRAESIQIGGPGANQGNTIINNTGMGVYITSQSKKISVSHNVIQENGKDGVRIDEDSEEVTVGGGLTESYRNIISSNKEYGVHINNAQKNVIFGNYIGTNAAGTAAAPNTKGGVYVYGRRATGNRVGGEAPTTRDGVIEQPANLISGNTGPGIEIYFTRETVVQGNFIGTDKTGLKRLANGQEGLLIGPANDNTIGSSTAKAGERNIISGNSRSGVRTKAAKDNGFLHNYIGVGKDGKTALGNIGYGIEWSMGGMNARENTVEGGVLSNFNTAGATNDPAKKNKLGRKTVFGGVDGQGKSFPGCAFCAVGVDRVKVEW